MNCLGLNCKGHQVAAGSVAGGRGIVWLPFLGPRSLWMRIGLDEEKQELPGYC